MKDITRTVITTTVKASYIEVVDGNIKETPIPELVLYGTTKASVKEINAAFASKEQKGKTFIIKEMKIKEEVRAISFEDFYKHSRVIERPASQQKKD